MGKVVEGVPIIRQEYEKRYVCVFVYIYIYVYIEIMTVNNK